jgi:predicted ATPase
LNVLARRGFVAVPEVARQILEEDAANGFGADDSRRNEQAFQDRVLRRKIELERSLDRSVPTFLDRGVPDTLAFYRLHGWTVPKTLLSAVEACDYGAAFLLQPIVGLAEDEFRTETDDQRRRLSELLLHAYAESSVPLVSLPVATVEVRVGLILDSVARANLGGGELSET